MRRPPGDYRNHGESTQLWQAWGVPAIRLARRTYVKSAAGVANGSYRELIRKADDRFDAHIAGLKKERQ